MTIYDQPLRNKSIRQLHHEEQLQVKIKRGETTNAASAQSATSEVISASLTPTVSVSANSVDTEVFTVAGVDSSMNLTVISQPSTGDTLAINVAPGDGQVTISFFNASGSADVPDAGEYKLLAVR